MVNKIKKVNKLDFTNAYSQVLNWFFSYPDREISLNDLSKNLNISKTNTNLAVKQLEKEGFLVLDILGRTWRIKCNKQHIFNYTRKINYNLSLINDSEIINLTHKIIPNPRSIILFGSYRKGDDTEKSDIDIAVEILDNKELQIVELGVFSNFGYRKDVLVNLHIFSRNKIDLNLFANIANGIVLEGFLEVRPWDTKFQTKKMH